MPASVAIIALGLFLGMRHATDPDHVVAITTIVSREQSILYAAMIGVLWGMGHTATILAVGSAIILLKITIPPALGLTMELSVAVMLILLGVLNLTGLMHRMIGWFTRRGTVPGAHTHAVAGSKIIHVHPSSEPAAGGSPKRWKNLGLFHILRPLMVGVVHGLAGSAAVALLVLTTIRQPRWAIGYLLIFGLGTIVGMMAITAAIALPFTYTQRHFACLNRGLALASGVISVSFGLFLCYQIGISDGLFTGHPNWMPH